MQTDDSERKAKTGIKEVQIVSSISPRKRPNLETEEGRTDVQAMVDSITEVFVNTIAQNRSVSIGTVLSEFGQGGLKVALDAVSSGMADRIGSLEQMIAGFSGKQGVIMTSLKSDTEIGNMTFLTPFYTSSWLSQF